MRHTMLLWLFCMMLISFSYAQKTFHVLSPDKKIDVTIEVGSKINWSVRSENTNVIAPSSVSLTLDNGVVLGADAKIISSKNETVNVTFNTPFYKKKSVADNYHQLTINCKGNYGILFRVYNDGAAYRFFTKMKGDITIQSEEAAFNFDKDYKVLMPYSVDPRVKGDLFQTSFESVYRDIHLSQFAPDSIAFLPQLIKLDNNKKAVITEADLEDYPGMYTELNTETKQGLQGTFAGYPLEEQHAGYSRLNKVVTRRAGYIARVNGTRNFPWRVIIISDNDAELANSDMIQKLSGPCRIHDISWIRPGKVAWDWWNDWNISHVNFHAGINTQTYKYYIDFAAANKLEYIIMDEGWSNDDDLMDINPKINLQEIIDYGRQKNVGVLLWATWYAVTEKMEEAFSKYAAMGIKGFKIDFMDRDDQKLVSSIYAIAKSAADHKLLLDFHGMYKPTGLQRVFPNIVNCEGVRGMEYQKWSDYDNVPQFEVCIPFIRMIAGPMDYTPGAMRNATRQSFRPVNSMPMGQGTRCHQMAMYVVYEAPLQMLSDNPTTYMKEQECTDFIAKVPTTFDETVALDGKVGEYVIIARKKDDVWYAGGLTNWDARDITLDLSFLRSGNYEAEIFKDGINADRDATDYVKETMSLDASKKITLHLAPGGGFAMRIIRK
ncbi:MAG TPA: glycoside hydrolase family 97 protein [Chitinophagaceae bacterium]|nr:glycoside hydrolase family 97 protein [Chitinophagaceae bacterium]